MNRLFVQTEEEGEISSFVELASREGFGIEVTAFSLPSILDSNWQSILEDYKGVLKAFQNEIAVHGVYLDIITVSKDSRILDVARERILHNLDIVRQLGAAIVIFPSCFNPSIKFRSYINGYKERQIRFWSDILDHTSDANSIKIVIENLWAPYPEIIRDVISGINSDNFQCLLDTGHVNLFSQVPLEHWIQTLADHLVYVHLNDNMKDFDTNLVPGEGNIDWNKFFNALDEYGVKPRICLEVEGYGERSKLENTIQTIEYLKRQEFYPF